MDECSLPKARPILCNESPAFQRHHMSLFCAAESPNRFPWVINTTFGEKTYIRWCCNDRLSSQRLPGTERKISFWFGFSCAEFQKFWLDPNSIQPFWLKFYVPILIESSNSVDLSEHAFEYLLTAQL